MYHFLGQKIESNSVLVCDQIICFSQAAHFLLCLKTVVFEVVFVLLCLSCEVFVLYLNVCSFFNYTFPNLSCNL